MVNLQLGICIAQMARGERDGSYNRRKEGCFIRIDGDSTARGYGTQIEHRDNGNERLSYIEVSGRGYSVRQGMDATRCRMGGWNAQVDASTSTSSRPSGTHVTTRDAFERELPRLSSRPNLCINTQEQYRESHQFHNMARAESSKDAESNGAKASAQGAPSNYELPW